MQNIALNVKNNKVIIYSITFLRTYMCVLSGKGVKSQTIHQ